ncbi:MAG: MBL fold metallo-hydrolase [Firmicutes bacterium]|nr:MBL fold metallo-hydrolase [Bacillota bacterium]
MHSTNSIRLRSLVVIALLLFVSVFGEAVWANEEAELTIRYLALQRTNGDVSEIAYAGDAILISTPQGKHILVDAGRPEVGPQVLTRLQELGVEYLDYAIATHPHVDHIGGFRTVLPNIPVGQFFQIDLVYDSSHYRTLQTLLAEQGIPNTTMEEGDIVEVEPGVVLEFFNPPAGTSLSSNEGLSTGGVNDLSLVFRLTYKDFSALITGDIYRAREEYLVEKFGDRLQSRFYDAPHHGQDTSSSNAFIRTVRPEVSVFSIELLGSILNFLNLRDLGSEVYVTGLNGEVLVRTNGSEIVVEVEREIDSPFLR